jgi:hypothetical protein
VALNFNNGTGDRVVVSAASSINDLDPFTWWGWVYVLGKTSSDRVFSKAQSASAKELLMTGTSGDLQFIVGRATTSVSFVTNNTPFATVNKWYFVAVTFNSSSLASDKAHIYVGDLSTAAAECTYSTHQNGSGTVNADNANNLELGNRSADHTRSFPGHIAYCGYLAQELTLAELVSLQWNPRVYGDTRGFWALGFNGTGTQPDWSGNGNSGTVTSATQVAHVPLGPFVRSVGGWLGEQTVVAVQTAAVTIARSAAAAVSGAAAAGAPATLARAAGAAATGLAGALASAVLGRFGAVAASAGQAIAEAVSLSRAAGATAVGAAQAAAGATLSRLAGILADTGEFVTACVLVLHRAAVLIGLVDRAQADVVAGHRAATVIGLVDRSAATISASHRPAAVISLADWCA